MTWTQIGRLLRVVFLLRVPLLTFLILTILGPISLTVASSLLGNVLDQDANPWNFGLISFLTFLLAATAITTINLVLQNGSDRIADPDLHLQQTRPLLTYLLGMCPPAVLVACVAIRTGQPWWWDVLYGILGFAAAMLMVLAAKAVQLWLTDPDMTPYPPPYLVFPAYLIARLNRQFDRLYCRKPRAAGPLKSAIGTLMQWPLAILYPAGQGYFDAQKPGDPMLRLRSGHVFAIALASITFFTYVAIGLMKQIGIGREAAKVSALAYILLFFMVACWSLGALAFFFDRYRFPLLWALAALSLLTTFVPESDHFYRVVHVPAPLSRFPKPSDILRSRLQKGKTRLILVATAGGGIQAAAWTAKVLEGLNELDPQSGSDFAGSVALISSVSGGSLGALSFARSYPGAVPGKDLPFTSVAQRAEQPALDEVAWGWVNPDFWRTIIPWFRNRVVDRAWAIEKKWAAIQHLEDTESGAHDTLLSTWAPLALNRMPAVIFNSMIVETGQPVVFSNTDFPLEKNLRGIQNFYEIESRNVDLRVNTAVRLSASFPYVAPAARSDADSPEAPDYHIVDGGYYDNFGINSLLAWLDEALRDPDLANRVGDLLILQIRPFAPDPVAQKGEHGWGFQLLAPIVGLSNMRDAAQGTNDATALEYFARDSAERGGSKVNIWTASFIYSSDPGDRECGNPPLSWKLSGAQKSCIDKAWDASEHQSIAAAQWCVAAFLRGDKMDQQCENPGH